MSGSTRLRYWLLATLSGALALICSTMAGAHSIAESDAAFVTGADGAAVIPFIYLGAKHMVTGVDHLLFLAGVIFFLYRPLDVIKYVTLFAVGHSLTLIIGVLANLRIDAHLVDAVIGLSIVYKALENMGALNRLGRFKPHTGTAVFAFGLCHGFGLATSLQALELSPDGLIANLVSFNIGVEIGQILALSMMLILFSAWRRSTSFERHAFNSNAILMACGFLATFYQLAAFTFSQA